MRAAANGADVGALEALVQQIERLARIAEDNRRIKNHENDRPGHGGITAAPFFAAAAIHSQN